MSYEYNPSSLGNPLFRKSGDLPLGGAAQRPGVIQVKTETSSWSGNLGEGPRFANPQDRDADLRRVLPMEVETKDIPAYIVGQQNLARLAPPPSLTRLMKEVPPNVVISSGSILVAPGPARQSGSSSPEPETISVITPKEMEEDKMPPREMEGDKMPPPNVTIEYHSLPLHLQQPSVFFPRPQEIRLPTSYTTPHYSIKVAI